MLQKLIIKGQEVTATDYVVRTLRGRGLRNWWRKLQLYWRFPVLRAWRPNDDHKLTHSAPAEAPARKGDSQ